KPSFIRVEADELTYNLHIMLRFEIERDLLEDRVRVEELPELWRDKMKSYLGVVPPTDREGVLQDVHWASGAIGYFPTYTLGNIYAAQLMSTLEASVGTVDTVLADGGFGAILDWLRTHVHRLGQTHRAAELI